VNTELAGRIVEAIEANPEQHDQAYWRKRTACGTTMCIAGWTCYLNGDEFVPYQDGRQSFAVKTEDGSELSIATRAADLLGLREDFNVDQLFWEDDDATALNRLRRIAEGDRLWWMAE
jgi:hypothetical protein